MIKLCLMWIIRYCMNNESTVTQLLVDNSEDDEDDDNDIIIENNFSPSSSSSSSSSLILLLSSTDDLIDQDDEFPSSSLKRVHSTIENDVGIAAALGNSVVQVTTTKFGRQVRPRI